ncbi:MAG: hypothetical protein PVJ57_06030 [Phycisphaerae bacterium]|jgi:tetratricopeptide (TPR) repeat protein
MPLSLETMNYTAFTSLTEGLEAIEQYQRERRIQDAERAAQYIDRALRQDPHYGLAVLYKGVVLDMTGRSADAVAYFARILHECPDPQVTLKARFNLGVANYHRYSHKYLVLAQGYFEEVIRTAADASLRDIARAYLAQTHAMWMIPSPQQLPEPGQPPSSGLVRDIREHFRQCRRCVREIRRAPGGSNSVAATCANALGMAFMYSTDYIARTPLDKRQRRLRLSAEALQRADRLLPGDWANTCDLGSVHLRLGVLARDAGEPTTAVDGHFEQARQHLQEVVDTLRPGYGFALYELGRLHRVWGRSKEASEYFAKAMEVPERYSDVSDARVNREQARINDTTYP